MIRLHRKFKRVVTTKKRYILITGGRGSAKSFALSLLLVDLLHVVGHIILFCRYTLSSAKDSIIPEFNKKIELIGQEDLFEINKTDIKEKVSGSSILFRGLKTSSGKQTAKLKGIFGLTTLVVDEAEEFVSEDDFDKIDESIREKGKPNRVILIMNPTTKDHWIYQRWFKNHLGYIEIDGAKIPISKHPDVEHIHMTYLDNVKHLASSFLTKIKRLRETNYKKYVHRFLGAWIEQAEGVIFENWQIGKFDESLPYLYGLDYGFFPDPLALVKVAVDHRSKKIYLQEKLYETELKNETLLSLIEENVSVIDLIVADTNEPRTTEMIEDNGFNIETAKKGAGSVAEDIREIQDYEIIVTEDSQNIINELNNYSWNNRKASIPIGEYDHAMAAMRYGFRKLMDGIGGFDYHTSSFAK